MAKKAILLGTSAFIASTIATPVLAQGDEIIVSATKREQTLQEVPVAVSVVSDETIEQANIKDLIDLQTSVPSLRVTQLQNSSQTNFVIRGFGNGANNPGIESSVGVFVDGVYRSRSASAILDLPTLERVEVLRGPQSTLFGKNVSAGAISLVTKRPEYEIGGSVEASYGNYDAMVFRGTLTGPISDTLAFRVSGSTNNRNGYYTNVIDGTDVNERDRWAIRGQLLWEPTDSLSFRMIGDWNKIDEVCCGAIQLLNGPATQFIGAPAPFGLGAPIDPDGDRSYNVAFDQQVNNQLVGKGLSLQADWDLGAATLTSITAYREQSDFSDTDVDFSGADLATNPQDRDFETFTQEIRLTSTGDNFMDWLIGGFYFSEDVFLSRDVIYGDDIRAYTDGLAMGGITGLESALMLPAGTFFAPGTGSFADYNMDNESYSIFAQLDFNLTDRLTVSGGVAYINDRKEYILDETLTDAFSNTDLVQVGFGGAFQTLTGGLPPTPANIAANPMAAAQAQAISTTPCSAANPPPACNSALALTPLQFFAPPVNVPPGSSPVDDGLVKGDKVTYTARVSYDFTDFLSGYFTYAKGWKAAAVNLSSDSRPPDASIMSNPDNEALLGREALPEDVTLYEIGMKANFDGGFINVALFDQTIEGFQSNLFLGTAFALGNAGEQSVRGFEIDSALTPWDPLTLTFGLTYLDPEYDSFTMAPCVSFDTVNCGMGEAFRDLSGTTPAGIHEVSLSTSATWNFPLGGSKEGYLRGEYLYESEVAIVDNVPEAAASREVNLVNLSAGVNFENGLEIMGWVRNLTDDQFLLSAFPTVTQTGSFSGYLNEPRTYGGTIRLRF